MEHAVNPPDESGSPAGVSDVQQNLVSGNP